MVYAARKTNCMGQHCINNCTAHRLLTEHHSDWTFFLVFPLFGSPLNRLEIFTRNWRCHISWRMICAVCEDATIAQCVMTGEKELLEGGMQQWHKWYHHAPWGDELVYITMTNCGDQADNWWLTLTPFHLLMQYFVSMIGTCRHQETE